MAKGGSLLIRKREVRQRTFNQREVIELALNGDVWAGVGGDSLLRSYQGWFFQLSRFLKNHPQLEWCPGRRTGDIYLKDFG